MPYKTSKKRRDAAARYYKEHRKERRDAAARYYKEHRKERIAAAMKYQHNHPEVHTKALRKWHRKHGKEWGQKHVIRISLRNHHNSIFKQKNIAYAGMPFHDAWNPDKGGSLDLGEQEILDEIGARPSNGRYDLHVIIKSLGVRLGNLMWVSKEQHIREEQVNKQAIEIKYLKNDVFLLREENSKLRALLDAKGDS